MLGITGADINVHRECRVAVLLQLYAYACATDTGEKWKQSSTYLTCQNNIFIILEENQIWESLPSFFKFPIQQIKPVY